MNMLSTFSSVQQIALQSVTIRIPRILMLGVLVYFLATEFERKFWNRVLSTLILGTTAYLLLIVGGLVSLLWFLRVNERIARLMNWVPQVPGFVLLGSALDFKDSSTFLPRITEYIQRYGKLVFFRIGTQNLLIVADYNLLEFVLTSNEILEKSDNYRFLHNWLNRGLLTATGPKWRERRKIITPTFHFKILEQFVDVFEDQANILVQKWEREIGNKGFNIQPYISLCTLDIICETAMGTKINAQENKNLDYVAAVKTMCRMIVVRGFSPFLMYDFLYKLSDEYEKEKKALKILHSHTKAVIQSRRKEIESNGSNTRDQDEFGVKRRIAFLDMLLQAELNGKRLTDAEIQEEVDTFMFEGHDTTTSAMCFAMHLLAKHPDVQDKIIEEQKELLGDDFTTPITLRELNSMKYLECVIKEVLRLYPSVPFYARRVGKDIKYKGNILPKDLTLFIYAYGVNRDPDNFPDPEKFDPDRFQATVSRPPFSYIPFSAGPRNCIGQKFAMLEMKSTISCILRNYKILPSKPEHEVILLAETVLNAKNGIRVRIEKR